MRRAVLAVAAAGGLLAGACSCESESSGKGGGKRLAPVEVSASQDHLDHVSVEWSVPEGAKPKGFVVFRDGEPLVALPADARSHKDETAGPGTVGAPVDLTSEWLPEAVVLAWMAAPTKQGKEHSYAVVATYSSGSSEPSEAAVGSRAAPEVSGYRLLRDGEEIATLPADSTSYEDEDADAGKAEPPTDFEASMGTRTDGVELQWKTNAEDGETHFYRLETLSSADGAAPFTETVGRRIGAYHEIRRDGGPWILAESGYLDLDAPLGKISGNASATVDRSRGFVELSLAGPLTLEPPAPSTYELRMVGSKMTPLSAQGARAPGGEPSIQWTSAGPTPDFEDIPGADSFFSIDPNATGKPISYRARVRTEGAEGHTTVVVAAANTFRSIAAGEWHTCGVRDRDGALICWGENGEGQAEPLLSADAYAQVAAGGKHTCAIREDTGFAECWGLIPMPGYLEGMSFTQLAAGDAHTCGILQGGGKVVCWGANGAQQAPQGPSEESYVALAAGRAHTCGLRPGDRKIQCWGANDEGQAPEEPVDGPFQALAAGEDFSCGLLSSGDVRCWGANELGQAPPQVEGPFVSIGGGVYHACGVREDGTVHCWGENAEGLPPRPYGISEPFSQVAVGGYHHCVLKESDRKVLCWGQNWSGQAPASLHHLSFLQVGVGEAHSCGILAEDRRILCWGLNLAGKAPVEPSAEAFREVYATFDQSCGLRASDGKLRCWGVDGMGEALPAGPSADAYRSVSLGFAHACGIREADGRLDCWGDVEDGRAPAPHDDAYRMVQSGIQHTCAIREKDAKVECWAPPGPIVDDAPSEALRSLGSSHFHACGIRASNGNAICWGSDDEGESSLAFGGAFRAVATGMGYSCGIREEDDRFICWGDDSFGQAPVDPSRAAYSQISTNMRHGCGVRKSDGRVHCWGADDMGEAPSWHAVP